MSRWTLVEHSGGDALGGPAVEEVSISAAQAGKVTRLGGVVFGDYLAACDAALAVNYPLPGMGLRPAARGAFVDALRVRGLRLYVLTAADRELLGVPA